MAIVLFLTKFQVIVFHQTLFLSKKVGIAVQNCTQMTLLTLNCTGLQFVETGNGLALATAGKEINNSNGSWRFLDFFVPRSFSCSWVNSPCTVFACYRHSVLFLPERGRRSGQRSAQGGNPVTLLPCQPARQATQSSAPAVGQRSDTGEELGEVEWGGGQGSGVLLISCLAQTFSLTVCVNQGCRFSVIFRFFRFFWPEPFSICMLIFSIFSYFIFLFLNFLSLFLFIFCETARTHRFSVIFA